MNLFVIDIGGSTIKYATWDGEQLDAKKSLPTPNSWKAMKEQFIACLLYTSPSPRDTR